MSSNLFHTRTTCRSCGSDALHKVLDLGVTPISDALRTTEQLNEPEPSIPLTLWFCPKCTLVQIVEEVDPSVLFERDYPYYSSVSPSLIAHFSQSAIRLIEKLELDEKSRVVEAGSNDGCMLSAFAERNISVLGIDPAEGPVAIANEKGIPTIKDFFSTRTAEKIVAEAGGQADLFLANNVLAHVPDLNGFVAGIATILKPNGVAVLEIPYVVDLMEKLEFDTIYHQHHCYFSVHSLRQLFTRNELQLLEVERSSIHGGSLRITVGKKGTPDTSVETLLNLERGAQIDRSNVYETFAKKAREIGEKLLNLVHALKQQGKSIVGYGAAAKANTLLSYTGIGADVLDYIADLSTYKQGLHMSGCGLPIVSPEQIIQDQPDYVLLLAWNFADEIIQQLEGYRGQYILPVPSPKIL